MKLLCGICKTAIEKNWCYGCSKLENPNFIGQLQCEYAIDPEERKKAILEEIKKKLGVQEKIDL